jgi:(p)ppGpp synthase/HD superfamily hydrolase
MPSCWPPACTPAKSARGRPSPTSPIVLGVASLALEDGADEDEAIAALLHDTVEDATGDPEVIRLEIR